jgi:hypothetical protein
MFPWSDSNSCAQKTMSGASSASGHMSATNSCRPARLNPMARLQLLLQDGENPKALDFPRIVGNDRDH